MKYSSIPAAHMVVQHCKGRGIKHIVISPGSRNAPLTLGFTGDTYFDCYSIVDERCAAFFALGIAQQTQQGVAVVCTSGSALLNYYPAVAEAFYSDIPLLVISADRPGYKIDIGDGQTIRQDMVFNRHIGFTALLKQDVVHAPEAIRASGIPLPAGGLEMNEQQAGIQAFNNSMLNRALGWSLLNNGPVHINVPLEEPLYETQSAPPSEIVLEPFQESLSKLPDNLKAFGELWNTSGRKMVLIGTGYPGLLPDAYVQILADDPSVLVFTETTSNCHHAAFFPGIDSIIGPIEKSADRVGRSEALQPDILLTLGGMVVSKKIKAFLRQYRPKHHWHIGPGRAYDTYYSLSHHFDTTPGEFFEAFQAYIEPNASSYQRCWAHVREAYRKRRGEYLNRIPFSDMLAFDIILKSIPDGYQLQLANSTAVRYSQLFDIKPSVRVFCNRGTSGIDGSTSTAIGASLRDRSPTLLITGDLSLFYDSNGLWNKYIRPDFRIIVLNNGGGGIFRILPGMQDSDNFETYFETVHDLNIGALCEVYGLEHTRVSNETDLTKALPNFYRLSESSKLLEICTPRTLNNNILLAYFDFLS